MNVESAKYTENGSIVAVINGVMVAVPDDPGNRHRQAVAAWEAAENEIAPYDPPAVTADQVKAEAGRRIELVMPAWMVARHVSGGKPIPPEVADAAEAIRSASGTLEAMEPIPADYTDDKWWS